MKIIAVMIEKGGAGKTTTAAALGCILGAHHRVLMIDADQQGNLSTLYGVADPEDKGLAALLSAVHGEVTVADVVKQSRVFGDKKTGFYRVDVIPANGYLMDANTEIATDTENDQVRRLQTALGTPEAQELYDYVIVDCGLLLDMTVLNALVAADLVVVPVKLGGFEADALGHMADTIEQLHGLNNALVLRSFFTMKGRNDASDQFEKWLKSFDRCQAFDATVSRSVIVERASINQEPVTSYSPRCKVSREYAALAREIMEVLK